MSRSSHMLTIDEQLEASRRFHSEKEIERLRADINTTREQINEVIPLMTQPMLQGIAQNEQEKAVIKLYNKYSRHWAKLMHTLTVWSWRK